MWMLRRIAVAAIIVGLFPIALVVLAFASSWVFDCTITESGVRPCLVFGADLSGTIGGLLTVSIPTAILLIPAAAIVVIGWAAAEAINFIRNA